MERQDFSKKVEKGIKIGIIVIFALLLLPSLTLCVLSGGRNAEDANADPEVGVAGVDFSYTDITPISDVGFQYQGKGTYTAAVELQNNNSSYVLNSVTVTFTAYNESDQVVGSDEETYRVPVAPGETFYVGDKIKNCTDGVKYIKAEIKENDTNWYRKKDFTYKNPLVVESATADGTGSFEAVIKNSGGGYINEDIAVNIVYMKDGLPIYTVDWNSVSMEAEAGESCTLSANHTSDLVADYDDVIVKANRNVLTDESRSLIDIVNPLNWGSGSENLQTA